MEKTTGSYRVTASDAAFASLLDRGKAEHGQEIAIAPDEAWSARFLAIFESTISKGIKHDTCFQLLENLNGKEKILHPTGAGDQIYDGAFKWAEIKKSLPLMRLSRVMTAFGELVEKHEILLHLPPLLEIHRYGTEFNCAVYTALNDVMAAMRTKFSDDHFLASKDTLRRGANSNYFSLMGMLEAAFEYRSKILSVRVDLYYKHAALMQMLNLSEEDRKAKSDRFHRDRADILKRITRRYGDDVVGYAWKKEFGKSRGLHLHLWVLLDGHRHQQAIAVGNEFGAMWSAATLGEGDFYNCALGSSKHEAVGVLQASDECKWDGLERIAAYLTKPDTIIRLELGDGRRVFQSTPPKKRGKTRGRPPKRRRAFNPFIDRRGNAHLDDDALREN